MTCTNDHVLHRARMLCYRTKRIASRGSRSATIRKRRREAAVHCPRAATMPVAQCRCRNVGICRHRFVCVSCVASDCPFRACLLTQSPIHRDDRPSPRCRAQLPTTSSRLSDEHQSTTQHPTGQGDGAPTRLCSAVVSRSASSGAQRRTQAKQQSSEEAWRRSSQREHDR